MPDDPVAEMMEELSSHVIDALEDCLERGMQPPFVMCAVSANGSVSATRLVSPETEMETLAEHFEEDGFRTPINIMIVDQAGNAVRVKITTPGAMAQTVS